MKALNLTNQVFGRLTAVSPITTAAGQRKRWLCRCVCKNTVAAQTNHLRSGHIRSCGCLMKETREANHIKIARIQRAKTENTLAKESRICSTCEKEFPLTAFTKDKSNPSGVGTYCKPCRVKRNRSQALKSNYNLTDAEYDVIFQHQHGGCAICGRPPKNMRLSVDHRHSDGLLRGLLCWPCNNAIGRFKENVEKLEAAISYLKNSPGTFPISLALAAPRYGIKGRVNNKAETRRKLNKKTI